MNVNIKDKKIKEQLQREPKTWIFQVIVALIFVILMAWSSGTVKFSGLAEGGTDVAKNIIGGIFKPDTKLLFNLTDQGVPYLLLETMCIAFLGTIVGAVLAIPIAFLSATNIVPKPIALVGRVIIMAIRTIPAFVYGLMFIRVTGPGPFAGLLTMSLCSIGMVSKCILNPLKIWIHVFWNH